MYTSDHLHNNKSLRTTPRNSQHVLIHPRPSLRHQCRKGRPTPRHDDSTTSDLTEHGINDADDHDYDGSGHPTLATVTRTRADKTTKDDAPTTTETIQHHLTRLLASPCKQDRLKPARHFAQPDDTTTPNFDCALSGEAFSPQSQELRDAP